MLHRQFWLANDDPILTGRIIPWQRLADHWVDRPEHSSTLPTLALAMSVVPVAGSRRQRGAIYARFSTKYQHSTDDQVRKCREWAEQHGIDIRPEHIFVDEAVTGRSSRRRSLLRLQQALQDNQVDVVIALATNRLFRKAYKAEQFIEEEIVDRKKRAVFIDTGIDTAAGDRWRQYFQMHAMLDEFTATSTVGHIRAAQEGLFEQGRVFGSLTFGYMGEEIPGIRTHSGRIGRRIVIDPAAAEWVKKAFGWFVDDRLSILQIAHRFNAEGAPPPPHVPDRRWSQTAVRRLLGNERYIGHWAYGKTKSTWNNAKSYTRQVPRDEPLKQQYFENLRIIDDVTFQKAGEILSANRHQVAGRKPRDTSIPRPKLLNGLLYCCQHDRPLIVGAHNGLHMFCPDCKKDSKPALYSVLPRKLATRRLCQTIADLIYQDGDLVEQVIAACQGYAETAGKPDPGQMEALKRKEAALTAKIGFVMDNSGDTDADRAESKKKIQALRAERSTIQAQIAELEAATNRSASVPTAEQVRQQIDRLADLLLEATGSQDPAQWGAARRVLESITGGRIVVTQQGEAKAKRGWLRGTFQVHVVQLLARAVGCDCPDSPDMEIHVDFREPPPYEAIAEQAKALFDQGMLYKDIAKQLNVTRALVIKAINFWFTSRGLPVPDGRLRRFELEQQTPDAYKFQQIAEEALELYDQGLLYKEIAERLDCDYTTVTKAVHHAQIQRGLTPVDGRTRLKALRPRSAASAANPVALQEGDSIERPSPGTQPDPATDTSGHTVNDMPAEGARPAA